MYYVVLKPDVSEHNLWSCGLLDSRLYCKNEIKFLILQTLTRARLKGYLSADVLNAVLGIRLVSLFIYRCFN